MKADYHVHSSFSDDSTTPMQEQVERAIALSFDELCFTDHVDYGIKKDWAEGNIAYRNGEPIANVDYPRFFAEIANVRDAYEGRCTVRTGLEFGMQTITLDAFRKLYARYQDQLDFVLLSCHQVDNQEFWTGDYQRGRTQKEYNERYYEELYAVMQQYKDYQVLAHLDLIARYDPTGVYPFEKLREPIAELLRLAIRDGKGIELNTSSWRYKLQDSQPSRAILRLYKELGGKILTIGSDAHSPAQLGAHYDDAVAILRDEIGFTEIYTFDHQQPQGHKL